MAHFLYTSEPQPDEEIPKAHSLVGASGGPHNEVRSFHTHIIVGPALGDLMGMGPWGLKNLQGII